MVWSRIDRDIAEPLSGDRGLIGNSAWRLPSANWYFDSASSRVWTGSTILPPSVVFTDTAGGKVATGFGSRLVNGFMFASMVDVAVAASFNVLFSSSDGTVTNTTYVDFPAAGGSRLRQTIAGVAQTAGAVSTNQREGKILLIGISTGGYQALQVAGGIKRETAQAYPSGMDRIALNGNGVSVSSNSVTTKTAIKYGPFSSPSAEFDAFYNEAIRFMLDNDAIHAEGDSFIGGAGGVSLPNTLMETAERMVVSTGVGSSSISQIRDRIMSPENAWLLNKITLIWDGDEGASVVSATEYCDILAQAVDYLGHNRYIIIPPTPEYLGDPTMEEAIRLEMLARWPSNVLDWRDWLLHTGGVLDISQYLAPPGDPLHLSQNAMDRMSNGITAFIAGKGW